MKFEVYCKSGCPSCEKILRVLYLSDMEHKIYKLHADFTPQEFHSKFGGEATFPQVILDENKHLGGCTDTIKYLLEKNCLNG